MGAGRDGRTTNSFYFCTAGFRDLGVLPSKGVGLGHASSLFPEHHSRFSLGCERTLSITEKTLKATMEMFLEKVYVTVSKT